MPPSFAVDLLSLAKCYAVRDVATHAVRLYEECVLD